MVIALSARVTGGIEAGGAQHASAGVRAQREGRGVAHRGQMADAPTPQPDQVRQGGRGAVLEGEAHRRAPRAAALDEHDVLVGRAARGRHHPEEQVAVDRAGGRRRERLLLPSVVAADVDQCHV